MRNQAAGLVDWIVAYGLVAVGMLLATLRTLNRSLGRLDESSSREKPFPRPAREPATRLPDAESTLDLELRPRPAGSPADPLATDH